MGGTLGDSTTNPNGDPLYITANAADGTRTGAAGATPSDPATDIYMYIATFSPFNTLTYGTYVDQTEDLVLNDLILLGDGRLAFAGTADCDESAPDGTGDEDCTNNGFPALVGQPPTNVQGTPGVATNNTDGVLGIINPAGGAFPLLNRIGGDGNDGFHGMLELSGFLYVGGRTSSTNVDLESPDDAGFTADVHCQRGWHRRVARSSSPDRRRLARHLLRRHRRRGHQLSRPVPRRCLHLRNHRFGQQLAAGLQHRRRHLRRLDPQWWRHAPLGHVLRHLQQRARRFPVRHLHRRREQRLPR